MPTSSETGAGAGGPAAIVIRGLAKRYRLGARQRGYRTLRETLTEALPNVWRRLRNGGEDAETTLWALRDFDIDIRQGEVVGVIGRNGAGKTTLLKLLSRITEPTAGRAELYGRVGSLLEVGTGFHPELSGRENIYLSSAILGMRRREIDRKFDEIVAFAELEKFIDTAVKQYSSGMYVRLAFSVAAHLEPEILLVDEVLAVGDFAFQAKCLGKLDSLGEAGRTVLLVSHNMSAIRRLADRTLWLDRGRLRRDGETAEVVKDYLEAGAELVRHGEVIRLESHPNRAQGSKPVMREVRITGPAVRNGMVPMGADFEVAVFFASPEPLHRLSLSVVIEDEEGYRLFGVSTRAAQTRRAEGDVPEHASAGTFRCRFEKFPLNQGTYYLTLQLQEGQKRVDRIDQACLLQFTPEDVHGTGQLTSSAKSLISWPTVWSFDEADAATVAAKLDPVPGLVRALADRAFQGPEHYPEYLAAQLRKSWPQQAQGEAPLDRTRRLAGLLARHLEPGHAGPILALGCRDGRELDELAARTGRPVRGLDLYSVDPRIDVGDMHALPFADATFGALYACHSLEHAHDLDLALAECLRVLARPGLLVAEVPVDFETTAVDRHNLGDAESLLARLEAVAAKNGGSTLRPLLAETSERLRADGRPSGKKDARLVVAVEASP